MNLSIDDLDIGIPSIDLPFMSPLETEKEVKNPIAAETFVPPVVAENPKAFENSRYFWPDGTQKFYCIKCRKGPYRKDENSVHKFGEHMIICNECKETYYTIKNNKREAKDYKKRDYDIVAVRLYNTRGTY